MRWIALMQEFGAALAVLVDDVVSAAGALFDAAQGAIALLDQATDANLAAMGMQTPLPPGHDPTPGVPGHDLGSGGMPGGSSAGSPHGSGPGFGGGAGFGGGGMGPSAGSGPGMSGGF